MTEQTGAVSLVAAVSAVVFFVAAKLSRYTPTVLTLEASSRTVGIRLFGSRHTRPLISDVDRHAVRTATVTL